MVGHRCGVLLQTAGLRIAGIGRSWVRGYRRDRGDRTCVAVRLAHAGPAAFGMDFVTTIRHYILTGATTRLPHYGSVRLIRSSRRRFGLAVFGGSEVP